MPFVQGCYASSEIQMGNVCEFTFDQTLRLVFCCLAFHVALAVIDLPLQQQLHLNKLKVSREEMKQSEGDPELKQSPRQKARKISNGQMLKNVPKATVIMVNPTHYAAAPEWDPESQKAPVVVAKGADHLAAKIREIAAEHRIPVCRDLPATRSICNLAEIDQEIRPEHFAAVAAAVQFIDRIKNQAQGACLPKQREVLRKIVALKRQSAPQRLRAIQMDLDRIVSDIGQLNANLHAIDEIKAGFDALGLAEEQGHARKLIADIRAAEAALAIKRSELHEARDAVKLAFHAREQLNGPFKAR